ncbi:MAG: hypothetical protein Q9195_000394 [Heterodermia aff. obscurata]
MPSQSELATTKQYDFSNDSSGGGQLMSKKVPRTETQPQVITNRKKSPYKADVRLISCVHGVLSETDRTEASLIVLEYHLVCTGGAHRYTRLNTRLEFRNQCQGEPRREPFVKAFAPFKQSEMLDPVEIEHSKRETGEISAGLSFTPGELGASLGREREKKYKVTHFALGQAFEEYTDGKPGSDAIFWELIENKTKTVGVPDTFRVALLIQRAHSEKFLCDFTLGLHGGVRFAVDNAFKKIIGIVDDVDPIIFDPALPPQGEIESMDPQNLGDFAKDRMLLQSLAPVHLL